METSRRLHWSKGNGRCCRVVQGVVGHAVAQELYERSIRPRSAASLLCRRARVHLAPASCCLITSCCLAMCCAVAPLHCRWSLLPGCTCAACDGRIKGGSVAVAQLERLVHPRLLLERPSRCAYVAMHANSVLQQHPITACLLGTRAIGGVTIKEGPRTGALLCSMSSAR
jgi:hypothetical protein